MAKRLIGPDILVYHTTMWIKDANTPQYILWHQDSTYFYLEPQLHVTAWVALSDASASVSTISRPGSATSVRRRVRPCWCGARTASAISVPNSASAAPSAPKPMITTAK